MQNLDATFEGPSSLGTPEKVVGLIHAILEDAGWRI